MPKKGELPDIINDSDISKFEFYFNNPKYFRNYPNNTIRYASTLMAKIPTEELTELAQTRRLWGKSSLFYDDRLLISGLLPEIAIYRALDQINHSIIELDPRAQTQSLAIVVPKFYPQAERDTLAAIAKDNAFTPYITDCTKAAGYWYALHYGSRMSRKKEKIMFIFFGASNFQAGLLEFRRRGEETFIKEIGYAFNDTIGGRDIDVLIADMLGKRYNRPITPKIEQLLLQEAKKIKEKLTLLDTFPGTIENIDEHGDFSYVVTKKELNQLIQPIIDVMKQTLSRIKKQPSKVLLLGGSTRIPLVQTILKKVLNVSTLSPAMAKDEQLSFAAAIVSASTNSDYRLPPINYTSLPIYEMNIRTEDDTLPFGTTALIPGENYWVTQSSDLYPAGSSIYMIWNQAGENTTFKQTKDGRWRFNSPKTKLYSPWKIQLILTARNLVNMEHEKLELQKTINAMELLLLQTREVLSNAINYTTEKERNLLLKAANVTNKWFVSQKKYNLTTLKYRYKMLDDAVASVFSRYQNEQLLPAAIANFTQACEMVRDNVRKWSTLPETRKPHRSDLRNLLKYMIESEMYLEERKRIQSKTDQPKLSWITLNTKTEKLKNFVAEIANAIQTGAKQPLPKKQKSKSKKEEEVYVYPPNSAKVTID